MVIAGTEVDVVGFLAPFLPYISTGLIALIGWVGVHAKEWLKAHVKNTKLQEGLIRLDDAVSVAVNEINQTVVEATKAANADGKLTPEERTAIMAKTLEKTKSYLGKPGLDLALYIFGVKTAAELDIQLVGRIEAAVADTAK